MKHIQIASLKKRLLSSLIDLGLIVGLFCLFYFTTFTKIVSAVQNYPHLNEVIKEEKLKSKLYLEKDGKIISFLQDDDKAGEDKLAAPTKDFYVNYLTIKDEEDKVEYIAMKGSRICYACFIRQIGTRRCLL